MTDLADHSPGTGRRVAGLRSDGAARGGHAFVEVRRRRAADRRDAVAVHGDLHEVHTDAADAVDELLPPRGAPVSAALLLQLPGPVQHDRDRDRPVFFHEPGDEEALAVGSDTVRSYERGRGGWKAGMEERSGSTRLERGIGLYVHTHEPSVFGEVEELLSVPPPLRLSAPAGRDLPLASRRGKGADIDLEEAGLVRRVGQPLAIRRELTLSFGELRLHERDRLAVSREGQHPDVPPRSRPRSVVGQEAAILRPVRQELVLVGTEDQLLLARAARSLLIEVRESLAIRGEHDAASIRRPASDVPAGGTEGEPGPDTPREGDQPDVGGSGPDVADSPRG